MPIDDLDIVAGESAGDRVRRYADSLCSLAPHDFGVIPIHITLSDEAGQRRLLQIAADRKRMEEIEGEADGIVRDFVACEDGGIGQESLRAAHEDLKAEYRSKERDWAVTLAGEMSRAAREPSPTLDSPS